LETRSSNESELLALSGLTNGSVSSMKLEQYSRKFSFDDLEASKKEKEERTGIKDKMLWR
jgi:hypothetical protein